MLVAVVLCLVPVACLAQATNAVAPAATNAVTPPSKVTPPVAPPPTVTPPPPAAPAFAASVADDQATLAQLSSQAQIVSNDGRLAKMEAQAAAIEARARAAAASAASALSGVSVQLARLTPRRREKLTPAEAATLASLQARRAALTAEEAQASALAAQARGAYSLIADRRRVGFSDRVLTRSASPLSPDFWTSLGGNAASDSQRLVEMTDEAVDAALDAPEPRGLIGLGGGLLLALALMLPARRWLERFGRRKTGEDVHAGFAKTGAALWVAIVDAGVPTLAMMALRIGAEWGRLLSDDADVMAGAAVGATAWAAGILALGRVLATERDASQRLLPLSDDAARRIRPPLLAVALVTGAGFMLTRLNYVVGASVAATIAANCAVSMAYAGAAVLVLVSFGRGGAPLDDEPTDDETAERAPIWTLISLVLSGAIILTLGAVLSGYSTLATLTSGQIFWLSLIAASAYLLMRFADDVVSVLFGPGGGASKALYALFRFRRSTIGQAGALTSAAMQVLVIVAALSLALTPFGQGGSLLFANLGQLGHPIKLGSAMLSPADIAAGVGTFIIGMALARAVQRWIERRYLPVTDWDSGVRNSVSTGVGYLGVGIALACALAATGLGFSQIALVASALSVGIGFGLQNVVQNFVSGVILLVERPVKVGDWVSIDGVEGDVRRIRVRATEIALGDRSTMIIPNSDLITKPVLNRTVGEPFARVEMKLSITQAADVNKARDLMLETVRHIDGVVAEPGPDVYIDSLGAAGAVNLICHFYVASPRVATRLRSDGYFAVLEALRQAGVAFAGPIA